MTHGARALASARLYSAAACAPGTASVRTRGSPAGAASGGTPASLPAATITSRARSLCASTLSSERAQAAPSGVAMTTTVTRGLVGDAGTGIALR